MLIPRAVPRGPIYRYHTTPPEDLSIRLGEFHIADEWRTSAFDPDKKLQVACSELFSSPHPSLPLQRLRELAPEALIAGDQGGNAYLNPTPLALRYHLQTTRELIEEPPAPEPPPAILPEAEGTPPRENSPDPAPPAHSPATADEPAGQGSALGDVPPSVPVPTPVPRVAPPAQTSSPQPPASTASSPKGFKFLPIFRRKTTPPPHVQETSKIPPVVLPPRRTPLSHPMVEAPPQTPPPAGPPSASNKPPPPVELPQPPLPPETPPEDILAQSEPDPDAPPSEIPSFADVPPEVSSRPEELTEQGTEPAPEPLPDPPMAPVFHLETSESFRPVPAHEPAALDDARARLQEIFMTEEVLSVERVLELCSGLPGIRSCILARDASILAVHNAPRGMDLISLTAHAAEMLSAIRTSTMRMGLGAIPAVTIHSEKGPVSFFHADDLALLVLHSDRGFVPGVRERLRDVVRALKSTPLPLPDGDHHHLEG